MAIKPQWVEVRKVTDIATMESHQLAFFSTATLKESDRDIVGEAVAYAMRKAKRDSAVQLFCQTENGIIWTNF